MMFWTKRLRIRALLAASLYEPLDEAEQKMLDEAIANDPRVRREAEELGRIRRAVRLETPEFTGDLVPLLRERLRDAGKPGTAGISWRWMSGAAMATALVAVGFVTMIDMPGPKPGAQPLSGPVASQVNPSPLKDAMAMANSMIASRDLAGARTVLEQALAVAPEDASAGAALQLIASMEFSDFQRYPEAFAAYDKLRTRYPDAFMTSPESIQRFNLLDEARRSGYSPMYALDAIRSHPGNAFEQCEKLMAQYPDSMVASLAMNEMRSMIGLPGALDGPSHVMALERVRNRCSDPAAVAQVTLALGNVCRDDLCDPGRARLFYNEAASSGHTAVMARAQEALAKLAVDTP